MTNSDRSLTPNQWIIAIGAVAALSAWYAYYISLSPWPFIGLGAVLLLISFLLPKSTASGEVGMANQKGIGMDLPQRWDENAITLGIERYRGDRNLLRRYVDGILGRFIDGQDKTTIEKRTAFLESFNRYAEVRRENFKWQRVFEKRAKLEEDLADAQAEIALQRAKNDLAGISVDPELVALQKRADRLEVEIQIAEREKTIADLKKTEPPPPPPGPSAAERRASQKEDLQRREKQVREEIEHTKKDPDLDEELRQRKLNALYEKLTEIHDALIALL